MGSSRAPCCISGERGKHGVGTWAPSTSRGEMGLGARRDSVSLAVAVATCAPKLTPICLGEQPCFAIPLFDPTADVCKPPHRRRRGLSAGRLGTCIPASKERVGKHGCGNDPGFGNRRLETGVISMVMSDPVLMCVCCASAHPLLSPCFCRARLATDSPEQGRRIRKCLWLSRKFPPILRPRGARRGPLQLPHISPCPDDVYHPRFPHDVCRTCGNV
jgi:hypothetical protein